MSASGGRDVGLLQALAANCGGAYVHGARAMGKPFREDPDVLMSDLGLPIGLPPNNATILTAPRDARAAAELAERIRAFFVSSPGGGYGIWSIWPGSTLAAPGLAPGRVPCMVREPGGEPRPRPAELEVTEVADGEGMREAWVVVDDAFCGGLLPNPYWDARVLSDDYRVWVGRVDGLAVATATAFIGNGFVGVYAVATLASARGRGYGEAVSWASTLSRPELPATLQASSMGRPVYERMGYRPVADFTVWQADRR